MEKQGNCDIGTLFNKSVPHILERIFFSLDHKSFKNCKDVCNAWRELITSRRFQKKAGSVYFFQIKQEEYKTLVSDSEFVKHRDALNLLTSSKEGNLERVRDLLSKGVDPTSPWQSHWRPLCNAINEGHSDVIKILLEAGANPHGIDNTKSPLHYAVWKGNTDAVKMLLDAGADPNKEKFREETPLDLAYRKNHKEVIQLLVNAGQKAKTRRTSANPEILHGFIALNLSAMND